MKKRRIMLLNKNGDVKVIKDEEEIFTNKCKYILVPIEDFDIDSFVMIKPKELLKFKYAEIRYQLRNKCIDEEDRFITDLMPIEKTVRTIYDFVNFIHSLDRLEYVNYVVNVQSYYNMISVMEVYDFSLRVYDNHDKVIYKYKYKPTAEDKYDSNLGIILEEIKDIYETQNDVLSPRKGESVFLNILHERWSIDKYTKEKAAVGISLPISQSVYFMEPIVYKMFTEIHMLKYSGVVISRKEKTQGLSKEEMYDAIDDCSDEVEVYFEYASSILLKDHIIEFIIYLKFMYMTIITEYTCSRIGEYAFKDNEKFDILSKIEIENKYRRGKDIEFDCLQDDVITLYDVVKELLR